MAYKLTSLKPSNVGDIPGGCRACSQWHLKGEENILRLLREWGPCGYIVYDGKTPAGFAVYGPPKYFPKSGLFPAGPISKDALFLACLYVEEGDRGKGLAPRLLQAVEKDCLTRGAAALESLAGRDAVMAPCVPVEFYLDNGFYILRDDRRHPLVRLDMKSLADWREVAGHALNSITAKKVAPAKAPA